MNRLTASYYQLLNIVIIVGSVLLCSWLLWLRIPGMELLNVTPNWMLIWVVTWSIKRTVWQGAIAGLALGWIYDGLIASPPSHAWSLIVVGVLTASLQKQKYLGEDFISAALIVFVMSIVADTVFAIQYAGQQIMPWSEVWSQYQQITITSAVISSLWTPCLYYPLDRWWSKQ